MKWFDYVTNNQEFLLKNNSEKAKLLLAIFYLYCDYENGGFISYLMSDSANDFCLMKKYFSQINYKDGISWINSVEEVYGSSISSSRDGRINRISLMDQFQNGEDPFEEQHQKLKIIFPYIFNIAEAITQELKEIKT